MENWIVNPPATLAGTVYSALFGFPSERTAPGGVRVENVTRDILVSTKPSLSEAKAPERLNGGRLDFPMIGCGNPKIMSKGLATGYDNMGGGDGGQADHQP